MDKEVILMLAAIRLQLAAATIAVMGTHRWDKKGDLLAGIEKLTNMSGQIADGIVVGISNAARKNGSG